MSYSRTASSITSTGHLQSENHWSSGKDTRQTGNDGVSSQRHSSLSLCVPDDDEVEYVGYHAGAPSPDDPDQTMVQRDPPTFRGSQTGPRRYPLRSASVAMVIGHVENVIVNAQPKKVRGCPRPPLTELTSSQLNLLSRQPASSSTSPVITEIDPASAKEPILQSDPCGADGVPNSVDPVVYGAGSQYEDVGGPDGSDQASAPSKIDLTAQEDPAPEHDSQNDSDDKDDGSGKDVPTAPGQNVAALDPSEEPAMHHRRAEIRRDALAALDVLFSRQMVLSQRTLIADTLAVTDGTALGSIAGLSDESEKLTVRVKRMVSSLDVEDDCHYWRAEDGSSDRSKRRRFYER
ncbi:hypothetical protein BGX34_006321 [Mortierella sp. NVP85]|nr:hypothetical protein BGX34_006321 [Mortierella sp. NVP85]